MIKGRNAMKGGMDRRMIYGNKNFTERVKRIYEIEGLIKPKGRPIISLYCSGIISAL